MPSRAKEIAKSLARALLGDYSAYLIYSQASRNHLTRTHETSPRLKVAAVDALAIESSLDPLIREQFGYAGPESIAYACFDQERIVAVCFYWFGSRYLARNFWPLADGEAKLVQIIALPELRGRGVATTLIAESCNAMMQQGFSRVYARIWHSNGPSLGAFKRAGWTYVALIIEVNPFRRSRPFRLRINSRLTSSMTDRA
jgi:RimJ/RimL family protein N-acetyltransferase